MSVPQVVPLILHAFQPKRFHVHHMDQASCSYDCTAYTVLCQAEVPHVYSGLADINPMLRHVSRSSGVPDLKLLLLQDGTSLARAFDRAGFSSIRQLVTSQYQLQTHHQAAAGTSSPLSQYHGRSEELRQNRAVRSVCV